jgi:hypothetical protein
MRCQLPCNLPPHFFTPMVANTKTSKLPCSVLLEHARPRISAIDALGYFHQGPSETLHSMDCDLTCPNTGKLPDHSPQIPWLKHIYICMFIYLSFRLLTQRHTHIYMRVCMYTVVDVFKYIYLYHLTMYYVPNKKGNQSFIHRKPSLNNKTEILSNGATG